MEIRALHAIRRKLNRIALAAAAQKEISRMHSGGAPACSLFANALRATLENRLTNEERAWVAQIESIRENLNHSPCRIVTMDYGSGSPGSALTDEEMYRGNPVTRTVGSLCRSASKPYRWALLLFKLIREFRPMTCLELGACLGISASYQAAALKLNRVGGIVTMEGAAPLASLAGQVFQLLGLDNISIITGRFQDTMDRALHEYGPVDYAFIDGHHDEKATLGYFEKIIPFLSRRAVLVFDDISWSPGMARAWRALEADRRVALSADLSVVGVCIIDDALKEKRGFALSLPC